MTPDTGRDYRKYLDPSVLARIGRLELRARLVVEGFFAGMHHSPHRGLSVEFADHRAYTQGDDIRHIDWKVFAKTDKYYIKEYEQETNLELMLVIDGSESMSYKSSLAPLSKFEYASAAASAIAYLALQQHDSVGLAVFDETVHTFLRPSNNPHYWQTLIAELERGAGVAKTSIKQVLGELAERLPHRTLIFLISDLFDDVESTLVGLKLLRYRKHEPVAWNIWDPAELSLDADGPTLFTGMEGAGELLVEPRALRQHYLEEVRTFQSLLRAGCSKMNIDYSVFDSRMALDAVLSGYLATRSARIRQRSSRVLR